MYIVGGHSLDAVSWFQPESMPMALEERKSTATITAGPKDPEIQTGAWLRDDRDPGYGIVWRAKSVETQYNTKTRTIQLEHIINTLRDGVMFGEVTPAVITGDSSATKCTAKQAVQYILGRQDDWILGTFASRFESTENPYNFNGETLFAALETVTASLDDAHWEYDMSSWPFKLHILGPGDDAESEMRMSRNIRTIRRTVDRSRMYTRLYPIGENNLHIDGDYVRKNEDLYGRICKIETDSSKKDKAELKRWAEERLGNHCEPAVTVTVDGLDLSRDTGEPLDRLTVCRTCRVPLPEFNTTITEKITKLQWADKIREPDKVTVTLANNREDIASIINRQNAKGGASARAKAKKDAEDHAWIDDTTEHVQMVAEAIIGQGPDGVDWSRVASLGVDGTGIHGRVTRAEGYMVTLAANIEMTEERLRIAFENAINCTRSEFQITAESLRVGFENGINCTRSEFQLSSESLRVGFENAISCTRSEFQMTAESLRVGFENGINCTRSEFQMTAESLRVGFENGINCTRSEFQMTAESLRVGFENGISCTRSEFQMTAESLRVSFENGISCTRSEFQMTSESLRVSFENGISCTRSEFQMTSESLRTSFESGISSVRSDVIQTASSWEAKISGVVGEDGNVTAASIAVAINGAGEGVATINASKIYLLGQTIANQITADYISTKIATLSSLTVASMNCTGTIGASTVEVGTLKFRSNSGSGYSYSDLKDLFVTSVTVEGPVDNVYTLKYHTANNPTGTSGGTFSRATSLSGDWSGNKYTVTASPQGNTHSIGFDDYSNTKIRLRTNGSPTQSSSNDKYLDVPLKIVSLGTGSPPPETDRHTETLTVNATPVYNTGKTDGQNSMHVYAAFATGNDSNKLQVYPTSAAIDSSTVFASKTFTVTAGATLSYDSNTHAYTATGKAYVDSVEKNSASDTTNSTKGYTDGYNNGKPVSGTAGGRTSGVTALVHDFTITKGDGGTVTLAIDVTSIYTAARSGYYTKIGTSWTSPTLTLTRGSSGQDQVDVTIGASATCTWDATNKKFTATPTASISYTGGGTGTKTGTAATTSEIAVSIGSLDKSSWGTTPWGRRYLYVKNGSTNLSGTGTYVDDYFDGWDDGEKTATCQVWTTGSTPAREGGNAKVKIEANGNYELRPYVKDWHTGNKMNMADGNIPLQIAVTAHVGTIDIPSGQITTRGSSLGQPLTVLRKKFLQAQEDYDWVAFRVDCSCGAQKWYSMDPHGTD